jgi:hypothetical protein
VDASGCYRDQNDFADDLRALPFSGLLDQGKGLARGGAIALHPPFCELQQKCFGRRNAALAAALADGDG